MEITRHVRFLLGITRSHGILRRYVVVNGFDGALTMLGLLAGFRIAQSVSIPAILIACLGAAIALGISGVASALISETAERQLALKELEAAMMRDLGSSAHGHAARFVPYLVAASNGLSPFIICLIIITPVWLAKLGVVLPFPPLDSAIALAFTMIFLLGAYLGRISDTSWLVYGLKALLVAVVTLMAIFTMRGL